MSHSAEYEPTPSEISRACQEIQQSWSEREWKTRAGIGSQDDWYPPGILRTCHSSALKCSPED